MNRLIVTLFVLLAVVAVFCHKGHNRKGGKHGMSKKDFWISYRCETPRVRDCNTTKAIAFERRMGGKWLRPGKGFRGKGGKGGRHGRRGRGGKEEGDGKGSKRDKNRRNRDKGEKSSGKRYKGRPKGRGIRGWSRNLTWKYYYNSTAGECRKLEDGYCIADRARFKSEEDCMTRCGNKTDKEIKTDNETYDDSLTVTTESSETPSEDTSKSSEDTPESDASVSPSEGDGGNEEASKESAGSEAPDVPTEASESSDDSSKDTAASGASDAPTEASGTSDEASKDPSA